MTTIGIIPARYASTRFPGKPLADLCGKTVIQRVYERANKSQLASVVVATEDKRILEHVESFGGKAVMTSKDHKNGTERCCEAAKKLKLSDDDVVINIQGDEPFIDPQQINLLAECFNTGTNIATLTKRITTNDELFSHHVVKMVLDNNQNAIYFSRSPIPHCNWNWAWLDAHPYYRHIGIYGYRLSTLKELVVLSPTLLEKAESLEQLRWIENDYVIAVKETKHDGPSIAIDTPEDLEMAKLLIKRNA